MLASFGGSEVDQSTGQLIIDQIEELVVTIIQEIRERPAVALAILAAVEGALVAHTWLRRRAHRRSDGVARK